MPAHTDMVILLSYLFFAKRRLRLPKFGALKSLFFNGKPQEEGKY